MSGQGYRGSERGRGERGRGDRGRGDRGRGDRGRGRGSDMPDRTRGGYQGSGQASRGDRFDRGGPRGGRGDRGGRGRGGPSVPITLFNPGYPATLDTALKQKEDDALRALTSTTITLPSRPAYGSKGTEIAVRTNYFALAVQKDMVGLYRYDAKVTRVGGGRDPPPAIIKRIITLFIEDHLRAQHVDAVSDLRATIISRQTIPDASLRVDVTYRAEGEPIPEDDAPVYNVALIFTGTLTLASLLNYTTSTNASAALRNNQDIIQAMNLVVGYGTKTNPTTITVGRNLHVSTAAGQDRQDLYGGLEALRAFVFSVRAATERLLINVQIKNLAFYVSGNLRDLAQTWARSRMDLHAQNSLLSKLSVEVVHIQRRSKSGNNLPRYKGIFGVANPADGAQQAHPPKVPRYGAGPKDVQFWLVDEAKQPPPGAEPVAANTGEGKKKKGNAPEASGPGRYITVFDFFRQRYPAVNISDPSAPVVNVGTRAEPSYLPMDVCIVRPGQVMKRKLAPEQTSTMLGFAARQPSANALSISTDGLGLLGLQGKNQAMAAFGMTVQPQLITVPGRLLVPPPMVKYAKKTCNTFAAGWNASGAGFVQGRPLTTWAVLEVALFRQSPEVSSVNPSEFVAMLKQSGINASMPHNAGRIEGGDEVRVAQAVEDKIRALDEQSAGKMQLLLVIMPLNTLIYNRIKHVCEVKVGILSQCVLEKKFNKPSNGGYFFNVALKINLKLGGVNHSIEKTKFGNISFQDTMFVGLDVTHPSPGSTSDAPSVAAIVSSIEPTLGQWPAALSVQTGRQEMVDGLDDLLERQLKLWRTRNQGRLPNNIIVYRDGVSEGQYQLVLDSELPDLQKAIDAVYSPAERKKSIPRLSIIIVGKRHHTRFYPTRDPDTDGKTGNPKNGLVVDRGVTEVGNWDFFLQAHQSLKGTAKPAHYYVIYDQALRGTGATRQSQVGAADDLEALTHHLCYLFGRATKAVSICPPAYYADLVCERARCYLSSQFAPAGSDSASNAGASMAAMQGSVAVHDRIKDKMFYI